MQNSVYPFIIPNQQQKIYCVFLLFEKISNSSRTASLTHHGLYPLFLFPHHVNAPQPSLARKSAVYTLLWQQDKHPARSYQEIYILYKIIFCSYQIKNIAFGSGDVFLLSGSEVKKRRSFYHCAFSFATKPKSVRAVSNFFSAASFTA